MNSIVNSTYCGIGTSNDKPFLIYNRKIILLSCLRLYIINLIPNQNFSEFPRTSNQNKKANSYTVQDNLLIHSKSADKKSRKTRGSNLWRSARHRPEADARLWNYLSFPIFKWLYTKVTLFSIAMAWVTIVLLRACCRYLFWA